MSRRKVCAGIAAVFIITFVVVPVAFANTTSLSDDPAYASGPFLFYCNPYPFTFEAGLFYTPTDGGCAFSQPSTISGSKVIAIFKGVPGSSTSLGGDVVDGTPTLAQEDSISFGAPTQGDDFFAAVYGLNIYTDITNYFINGGPVPAAAVENQNYYVLRWKWGVPDNDPPVIAITSPVDQTSYFTNDTLFITATITDLSPIAKKKYFFNNALVDATLALPLSSTPAGTSTVAVVATDIFGHTATATVAFGLVVPDLQPPVINITNPQNGSTHFTNEMLYPAAVITDASSIAETLYRFNGTVINPADPLPLAGAPLGAATVSVTATDVFGNTDTRTSSFTIAPPDPDAPIITITSPLEAATYLTSNTIYLAATITDASGVASKVYKFNGAVINNALPLPLSSAPLGDATVSVTATDIYGNTATSMRAFTIATPPPISSNNCAFSLSAGVRSAVSLTGSAAIKASNCGIQVNSDAKPAEELSGSATITSTKNCVVGTVSKTGTATVSPTPVANCTEKGDPFVSHAKPAVGACTATNLKVSGSQTTVLNPGVYCGGITVSGSAKVTLNPGIYIIKNGDFNIAGSGKVTGNGVALFMTGAGAGFTLTGSADVHLVAPASGTLAGFAVYLDSSIAGGAPSTASQLSGSATLYAEGVTYLPNQKLILTGSAKTVVSPFTAVVAGLFQLTGSALLNLSLPSNNSSVPVPTGL